MEHILNKWSWDNIPLKTGKQIFCLPATGLTEDEQLTAVYSILTGENLEEKAISEIVDIKKELYSLIQTELSKELIYEFDIAGDKYYLEYDLSRIPFGLYIDFQRIIKDSSNNIWSQIEQIMACLIRRLKPYSQIVEEKEMLLEKMKLKLKSKNILKRTFAKELKKEISDLTTDLEVLKQIEDKNKPFELNAEAGIMNYELEEYNFSKRIAQAKIFLEHMTVSQAWAALAFFLTIGTSFIHNITSSLQEQLKLQNKEVIGSSMEKIMEKEK